MKTVYIINSLEGGGAERVFVELTSLLARDKANLSSPKVILLDKLNEVYDLPDEVEVYRIGRRAGLIGSLKQFIQLHRLLKQLKADLTVSFLTRANIMAICSAKLRRSHSIISERSNTSARLNNRFSVLKRWVVGFFYRRADYVIAVSQGVSDCLTNEFRVQAGKIAVLNNPVDIERINAQAELLNDSDYKPRVNVGIVAMGRLVKSKGFEDLIRGYKLSGLSCGLTILGDGPERERLVSLVAELDLIDEVLFLGFVGNPHQTIKQAEQFVLCSHLEGFPNALLEAMALRKPVVATDCVDGPREILALTGQIESGEFENTGLGLMVNVADERALAKAMKCLHKDELLRDELASRAQERVHDFSKDNFYLAYSKILVRFKSAVAEHV